MPVIRVMESSTVDKASPALKTPSQVVGIHVSMETQNTASSTHQPVRIRRSICGVLDLAAVGGGGGSMVERGSLLRSSVRIPGRMRSAATRKKNGSAGMTAEYKRLAVGR